MTPQAMVDLFQRHVNAELAGDLDTTMATMRLPCRSTKVAVKRTSAARSAPFSSGQRRSMSSPRCMLWRKSTGTSPATLQKGNCRSHDRGRLDERLLKRRQNPKLFARVPSRTAIPAADRNGRLCRTRTEANRSMANTRLILVPNTRMALPRSRHPNTASALAGKWIEVSVAREPFGVR